jgi:queuine tRNA-ribosyltransferase
MTVRDFSFRCLHVDASCSARRSVLHTHHGPVDLPAFMPVGTCGTVKGLTTEMVLATGAQMILGNTYHLALRPGAEIVAELGGLHAFAGWSGPILTDSGGFQVFSLAQNTRIEEAAAIFRSHIDGRLFELSPERAIEIQELLGSDIAMVLDHVVPLPADPGLVQEACRRTVRWAERCRNAGRLPTQAQFAIVQGGLDPDQRVACADQLVRLDFEGYAIGGLSVGESADERNRTLDVTCPALPADKPRYLMGVGTPADILEAISRGVDLFDCVMPSRNGRNAMAFTDGGPVRLRNAAHQRDPRPLEEHCPCPACRHSRAYLRHLFQSGEMLGPILLTAHNLTYYQRLLAESRLAIAEDRFAAFAARKLAGWAQCGKAPAGPT